MKHISNEQKAREIANDNCTHICLADCSAESYFSSENDCYNAAMQAMKWKDKERKELWRITRNHYQEWAEEQIAQEKQKFIDKCKEFCDRQTIGEYYNRREIFQIDKYIDDMLNFIKGE